MSTVQCHDVSKGCHFGGETRGLYLYIPLGETEKAQAMKNLDINKWEQKYELQKIENATSLMKKRTEKFDGQDRERGREHTRCKSWEVGARWNKKYILQEIQKYTMGQLRGWPKNSPNKALEILSGSFFEPKTY